MSDTAILLIHSEEEALQMQEWLHGLHVEVIEWNRTGTQWFSTYQAKRPKLLFVDLVLPRRDGLRCVEKIHELSPYQWTCFMHPFQGMAASHVELKALAYGASAVLQRPFAKERLGVAVERYRSQSKKVRYGR